MPAFLPAGVGTSAQLFLVAVSCRAAGACTAAGHFVDDRGATQGLLTTETSGRWAVGVEAPLPADTSADPSVTLNSVACGSPGNCVAVGEYEDGSGHTQGLLLTQTSGAWAAGVKVPLPGDAAANPQVRLTSVSCAAASQCAAVGVYSDGSGGREALLLSDASGTWTASAVSLPGDASSGSATDARLNGVACPTAGNCTAVGEYEVGFSSQALLVIETAGTWAAGVTATMPSDFLEDAQATAVSCPSAGNCTAVGGYTNTSFGSSGLVLTETAGTWATGLEPSIGGGPAGAFGGVSCPSVGNCSAVGGYFPGSFQGELFTETAGVWSTGAEMSIPGGSSSAHADSVSCTSPGNCVAIGDYLDNDGNGHSLRVTETSGHWAEGVDPGVSVIPVSCPSAGNCAAVGASLLDESSGTWKAPVAEGGPADSTATAPNFGIDAISCVTGRNCAAVGGFLDTSFHQQGLLLTETGGVWANGQEPTPPANAGTNPGVALKSVSCGSPGNCAAVGFYLDSSGNQQGLLVTEVSGTWGAGQKLTLPAGAASSPAVTLAGVSCPTAGSCSAVGEYNDGSGKTQGVLVNETSGTWSTGQKLTPPSNAAANPEIQLNAVSCSTAGNCAAVGHYDNGTSFGGGLLVDEAGGAWHAGIAATPPAGGSGLHLFAVSCPSAGNCGAAGGYDDGSGNLQGGLFDETSGTWGTGVAASLPAAGAASNPGVGLSSISCPSPHTCAAVGEYSDSSFNTEGLLLTESSGTWAQGVAATIPGGGTLEYDSVSSVSCLSAGNCAAVGAYNAGSGQQALLLDESGGTWETGEEATLPAPGTPDPNASLDAVSCAAGGCSAAGQFIAFTAGFSVSEGFLVGGSINPPAISSFSPTLGRAGTVVTITGSRLAGATAVTFGGAAAQSFTVNSDTQITATVAAGTPTGKVSVTTPDGTATSSSDFDVFGPPTITGFTPTTAAVRATVTVNGTNLVGATSVRLGATAVVFTVVSASEITFTVPAGAASGQQVTVITPGGTATSTGTLAIAPPPTITGFSPGTGPVGTPVTITGTNLTGTVGVMLGTIVTVPTSVTATTVVFTIPPGASTGVIRILNLAGSATSLGTFTVTP